MSHNTERLEEARRRMEEVTGLKRQDMDRIFQEVKANQRTLEACARPHNFSICLDRHTRQPIDNPTPQQRFGCKWRCATCGGTVDGFEKRWYEQGLADAKKPSIGL